MTAIDREFLLDNKQNPTGDRVVLTLNGTYSKSIIFMDSDTPAL
jgi:cyanate lyase